jgi:hypothetical protein
VVRVNADVMRLVIAALIFSAVSRVDAGELVLLGTLKAIEKDVPHCGVLYVGSVAEYEVLEVISGAYTGRRIFVVHGCVEMPRSMLSQDAGTLTSFAIGDVHKLVLVPENVHGVGLFNANKIPASFSTYFCKKADRFELRKSKSHNSALVIDAYASALCASCSAPQRER